MWPTRCEPRTRHAKKSLHLKKVEKDKHIFEKHIKPFLRGHDIKEVDADLLEQFKGYLADQDLSVGSQFSYINVVMALLKEAQMKKSCSLINSPILASGLMMVTVSTSMMRNMKNCFQQSISGLNMIVALV